MEVFDHWYFTVFSRFNSEWKEANPGIMEFNKFFERFYEEGFLPEHGTYMLEYVASSANKKTTI